jgi:hypothetical protein
MYAILCCGIKYTKVNSYLDDSLFMALLKGKPERLWFKTIKAPQDGAFIVLL